MNTDANILPVFADPEVTICAADPQFETPPEDHVRWSIAHWCAINYSEDFDQIGDGRGLHITVSTRDANFIRTVTPDQLRAHAQHLIGLADRADERAGTTMDRAEVDAVALPEALAEVERLKGRLAEVREQNTFLSDWSNAIALRVPEEYEASEGTQEGCIEDWLSDLLGLASGLVPLLDVDVALDVDALERLRELAERTGVAARGDES